MINADGVSFAGPKPVNEPTDNSSLTTTEQVVEAPTVISPFDGISPVVEVPIEPILPAATEAPAPADAKPIVDEFDLYFTKTGEEKPKPIEALQTVPEEALKWKERSEQFESILQDPFIKDYLELKESPDFNFDAFVAQFQKADFSNWSDEQVYKASLQGLNLTDEEVEEDWDRFQGQTAAQKKIEINSIKTKLESAAAPKGKDYGTALKAKSEEQRKLYEQDVAKQKKIAADAVSFADSLTGKRFMGYTLQKEDVDFIKNKIEKGTNYYDEKGNFNHEAAVIDIAKYAVFEKAAAVIKEAGANEFWKERANPSKTNTISTPLTPGGEQTRKAEGFQKAFSPFV